jgi:deoxyadenosine/deoxycytidine kinase
MTTSTTTYEQLLDRIIADGIAEVREAYTDPKDRHKHDGALEGFEACRGKTPAELVALWTEAEKLSARIRERGKNDPDDVQNHWYWKSRYKALQIEFILNVVSVGLNTPLLAHLPTYRGAMKYAQIVGVRNSGEGTS